ncbi:hypothetical protein DRQ33_01730 [bacterium]|nr:MAG: hypothetical protein DRQ33_01730 [bacterium]
MIFQLWNTASVYLDYPIPIQERHKIVPLVIISVISSIFTPATMSIIPTITAIAVKVILSILISELFNT